MKKTVQPNMTKYFGCDFNFEKLGYDFVENRCFVLHLNTMRAIRERFSWCGFYMTHHGYTHVPVISFPIGEWEGYEYHLILKPKGSLGDDSNWKCEIAAPGSRVFEPLDVTFSPSNIEGITDFVKSFFKDVVSWKPIHLRPKKESAFRKEAEALLPVTGLKWDCDDYRACLYATVGEGYKAYEEKYAICLNNNSTLTVRKKRNKSMEVVNGGETFTTVKEAIDFILSIVKPTAQHLVNKLTLGR